VLVTLRFEPSGCAEPVRPKPSRSPALRQTDPGYLAGHQKSTQIAALSIFLSIFMDNKTPRSNLATDKLPARRVVTSLGCKQRQGWGTSLGLFLGTTFEPRNIGLMFGFVILPVTFLGGIYYQWTRLAPVQVGGWHWLQTIVLVNPLIYVNEGMRAAFTNASHMHLYVVYPVLVGFTALFLGLGLRNFRQRVLS
jgi:hypothetical protein